MDRVKAHPLQIPSCISPQMARWEWPNLLNQPRLSTMINHPITKIIRERRSVKPALLRPDPVPRKMIELLLENANWAPTHGLTEPWRFHIFTGESRQRLAKAMQSFYKQHTPIDKQRTEKLEKLGKNPLLAPVVITISMHPDPTGKIPEQEEIAAVACAVQNMHLTASALGLGGFWSSPPLVYSESMRDFLTLDPGDRCLGLFYLGWPQEGLQLESRRSSIDQKSSWQ